MQCRGHLLTIIKGCMPLSNASKSPLQQQAAKDQNTNHKKRKSSGNSPTSLQPAKKLKEDSTITMTESQKRANFSALTNPSNGLNRHASPLLNNKPGAAKKLVIKNFKGKILATFLRQRRTSF